MWDKREELRRRDPSEPVYRNPDLRQRDGEEVVDREGFGITLEGEIAILRSSGNHGQLDLIRKAMLLLHKRTQQDRVIKQVEIKHQGSCMIVDESNRYNILGELQIISERPGAETRNAEKRLIDRFEARTEERNELSPDGDESVEDKAA